MKIIKELTKLPKTFVVSALVLFASSVTSLATATPVFVFDSGHDFSTHCERNNVYQSNFSDTDLLLNQCYSGNKAYFEITGMNDFVAFATDFGSSLNGEDISSITSSQDFIFDYNSANDFFTFGAKNLGLSNLTLGFELKDGFNFDGFSAFETNTNTPFVYNAGSSVINDLAIEHQFVVSAVADDSPSPSIPAPASFGLLVLAICGMKLRRTKH